MARGITVVLRGQYGVRALYSTVLYCWSCSSAQCIGRMVHRPPLAVGCTTVPDTALLVLRTTCGCQTFDVRASLTANFAFTRIKPAVSVGDASKIREFHRVESIQGARVRARGRSRIPLHRRGRELLQTGHGKRGFHTRLRIVTLFTDPVVAFLPSQRRHQKLTTALHRILLTSFHALPQILQNKCRSRFPV